MASDLGLRYLSMSHKKDAILKWVTASNHKSAPVMVKADHYTKSAVL